MTCSAPTHQVTIPAGIATGCSAAEACTVAGTLSGYPADFSGSATCYVYDGSGYIAYSVGPYVAPPDSPASAASAIQCTASSPCTMTLTKDQWDGGYALVVGAAIVIAFALGYQGGWMR